MICDKRKVKPKCIAVSISALAIVIGAFIHQQANYLSNIPESKLSEHQKEKVEKDVTHNRAISKALLIGGIAFLVGSQFISKENKDSSKR